MKPKPDLRAPFPWFGGKSRVSGIVWDRFGDIPNYVEPFFGSGAVLLALPVFLLPARTDTKWFHQIVLPHAK